MALSKGCVEEVRTFICICIIFRFTTTDNQFGIRFQVMSDDWKTYPQFAGKQNARKQNARMVRQNFES